MHARVRSGGFALGLLMGLALTGCGSSSTPQQSLADSQSLSPVGDQVYECLTERGWNVDLTWDGGIETSSETIPEAQLERYNADSAECWAVIDDRVARMDQTEIAAVYEAELATRECLIDHGYAVDEAPSEQQYVDEFFGARWSAYGASNAAGRPLPGDDWRVINEACPQPAWSLGVS